MSLALLMSVSMARGHGDGYHHMVVAKSSGSYGVQRQVEVTNPDVDPSLGAHFVAPLWWLPSEGGGWAEIGWAERGHLPATRIIYTWDMANPWASYPQYPIEYGDVIRFAIVPHSQFCPYVNSCLVNYRLYWNGQWQIIGSAAVPGSNVEPVHMGYEYLHVSGSGYHGELAGAASDYNVNNYDAELRSSTGTWSDWTSQPSSYLNKPPYHLGFSAQYTDYYGYCAGSC